MEQWRPILGYEGFYEVSDLGHVRSLDRTIQQLGRGGRLMTRRLRGRVLRPAPNPHGYLHVNLRVNNIMDSRDVHTLVLQTFVGLRPRGMWACHNDGDPSNNRLSNLRWDTVSANHLDKIRHGTHHLANRLTCPRNHQLVMPNLVASAFRRGGRNCLACNRGMAAIRNALRRGAVETRSLQEISDLRYAEIMAVEELAS